MNRRQLAQVTHPFFPVGSSGPALLQIEEAKAVCHRFPVRENCPRWALEEGRGPGVCGGTSEAESRTVMRRAARARARSAD
ncbi:WhiB family transcriptional regulator [Streptomyces sp. NPDC059456]|uniref:WhiB family transcriptional regulator n=1 Tax=Streptomyces sp. NPDC059456 TaxID=3346838 RepID=UPI0036C937CB